MTDQRRPETEWERVSRGSGTGTRVAKPNPNPWVMEHYGFPHGVTGPAQARPSGDRQPTGPVGDQRPAGQVGASWVALGAGFVATSILVMTGGFVFTQATADDGPGDEITRTVPIAFDGPGDGRGIDGPAGRRGR